MRLKTSYRVVSPSLLATASSPKLRRQEGGVFGLAAVADKLGDTTL